MPPEKPKSRTGNGTNGQPSYLPPPPPSRSVRKDCVSRTPFRHVLPYPIEVETCGTISSNHQLRPTLSQQLNDTSTSAQNLFVGFILPTLTLRALDHSRIATFTALGPKLRLGIADIVKPPLEITSNERFAMTTAMTVAEFEGLTSSMSLSPNDQQPTCAGDLTFQSITNDMTVDNGAENGLSYESPMALKSFEKFPDLPIELRLMIGKFALPPRIVDFSLRRNERRVSRVSSACAIDDTSFFDSEVGNLLFVEEEDEDEEEEDRLLVGPMPLTSIQFSCLGLTSIMQACHESRNLMIKEGYSYTFGMLGSRATTLFSSRSDTIYIHHGLNAYRDTFTPGITGQEAWDLGNVEKLAVGMDYFGHEGIDELDWVDWADEAVDWAVDTFKNLKVTFVLEYEIGTDFSDLAFMDLADLVVDNSANTLLLEDQRGNGQPHQPEQHPRSKATELFEKENNALAQWLSAEIDLQVLPMSGDKLKDLTLDKMIVTTSNIKSTFNKSDTWYESKNLRCDVNVSHMYSETDSKAVVHDATTIRDLCLMWVDDWAHVFHLTRRENIKICRHGVDLDADTRVLDIEDLREDSELELKVWDGNRWR